MAILNQAIFLSDFDFVIRLNSTKYSAINCCCVIFNAFPPYPGVDILFL